MTAMTGIPYDIPAANRDPSLLSEGPISLPYDFGVQKGLPATEKGGYPSRMATILRVQKTPTRKVQRKGETWATCDARLWLNLHLRLERGAAGN